MDPMNATRPISPPAPATPAPPPASTDATPRPPGPLLLTQRQAAALLGVSRSAWFRLRAAGALPLPVRPTGGDLMWRRRDLEKYVDNLRPVKRARRIGVATAGATTAEG
jgi:predicted DNA-binding transcriptional regulator AlpA